MGKTRAKYIIIEQAEGHKDNPHLREPVLAFNLSEASGRLNGMAAVNETILEREGVEMLGGLKTDFTIVWTDGETYSGTFLLNSRYEPSGTDCLGRHILEHCEGAIELIESGNYYGDDLTAEDFEEFLATYDLELHS